MRRYSRTSPHAMFILCALLAFASAPASAGLPAGYSVGSQSRTITAMAGSAAPQSASASGLGLFDDSVEASDSALTTCGGLVNGSAYAAQHSEFRDYAIVGEGSANSSASGGSLSCPGPMPTSADSHFECAFTIDQTTWFSLDGRLGAFLTAGSGFMGYTASVTFEGPSGVLLSHTASVFQGTQFPFGIHGSLDPGEYHLLATAHASSLAGVPGSSFASGTGNFTFTLSLLAGDADVDGDVDVDDLLSVIAAWGACPSPCVPHCAGDVTHDCTINVDDLLLVIANWG